MLKFGRAVTKHRKIIIIVSIILLIPSFFGYIGTRVNYDILTYLPDDIETVEGQNILLDEFNTGGFSMVMFEGMDDKDVLKLKQKFENVKHVNKVIWYDSVVGSDVPQDILPESVQNVYTKDDTTLMCVLFDSSVSSDETLEAIAEIRRIGGKQCYVSGMSAFVEDLKELAEKEEPIYVLLAVILALVIMSIFMDSWLIGIVFLIGIGITIIYNLGTNIFLGEISYITKALSAVLQLAVTMDYSIFLWHSYEEEYEKSPMDREEAMSNAIANTLVSVSGSSITTIAGFLALCFMSFTLGKDLGIVMAKGVLFGVIGSVTILPALILAFEKPINRLKHKPVLPDFSKSSGFLIKHKKAMVAVFLIMLVPALYGYTHTSVYYNLDSGVPQNLAFKVANNKLEKDFNISTTHMLLVDNSTSAQNVRKMTDEIEDIDGVQYVLGLDSVLQPGTPREIVPDALKNELVSENYELMLIGSEYAVASDDVNEQINKINEVVKKYDNNGMLIGEAPCTKDLITTTDRDFKVVTIISVLAILLIIFFVLKSCSLPFILVACIELAIFINLGIPFFTGKVLSFIDSICISTIQLGSTVDYAILMTTRYKKERIEGHNAEEAVRIAHATAMPSIVVSALSFFAATFGVGIYSNIDIISSMCKLMARGAIISCLVVMLILPAMLLIFDKIIVKTTKDMRKEIQYE